MSYKWPQDVTVRDVLKRLRLVVVLVVAANCSAAPDRQARQFQLRGQVLALVPDRHELTVKHDDIPGFMPAMTMAYRVKDETLLQGLSRGDLISATLNVQDTEAWLSVIRRTGHADVTDTAPVPRVMDVLEPGDPVPDTVLQDESGGPRRLTDWRGRAVAVTFIYTRCPMPDFCPLMERQFAEVQQRIEADAALADAVHLLAITFDPQHDTPDVLKAHARARRADPRVWTYLTGTPSAIEDVASRFGVSVMREQADTATLTHNLRTAVIDPRGRLVKIYSGSDWTPAMLLEDLREARGRR
jgi:protein SCO1